jgi:hydrogenase maturation protease
LVFLDAVEFGAAPGSVVFLNSAEMAGRFPQVSTHKIALGVLAQCAETNGSTRAWLLGVQPESLQAGQPLTATMEQTLSVLREYLLAARPSPIEKCVPTMGCAAGGKV